MDKYREFIFAALGVLYAILIALWPDADFNKTQFLTTGMTLIIIIGTASSVRGVATAFARSFDWKAEFLKITSLLKANGIRLNEEHMRLIAEILGILDQQFENQPVPATVLNQWVDEGITTTELQRRIEVQNDPTPLRPEAQNDPTASTPQFPKGG